MFSVLFKTLPCPVLGCFLMLVAWSLPRRAGSDEGMWLYNNLPVERLEKDYQFRPTQEWAGHLMKAGVRFNVGGSGAFVSSRGLVLTNHHVGSDSLQKLSNEKHDYLADGYLARTPQDEIPATDLVLDQLVFIEDVTKQVNASVDLDDSPAQAAEERRAIIAEIERKATAETKNYCDVVTLYGGGRYHLYQYKRYTDVRLVWAPEAGAAFFGGDADNFEYPRHCLDACLFRVYENGKPAVIRHFLKWNENGPQAGELVFVSGNPGSTSRIYTTAALKYERDLRMPDALNFIRRREILLQQYSLGGPEFKRQASDELSGFQNSRKAFMGMLAGLQDPCYLQKRIRKENALLEKIRERPELADYAGAWQSIAEARQKRAALRKQGFSLNTRTYSLARTLVRLVAEDQKNNEERFPEFRDSARDSLENRLLSTTPIYPELEQAKLADLIARTIEIRGADSPLARMILKGKSPAARAKYLIANTQIHDPDFRRRLYEGDRDSILASEDALIRLARTLDHEERRLRKAYEELDEVERQAYARIAEVMFAIRGTSVYPDATFSPRLAYGVVKGYEENGQQVAPFTTIGGAFEREAHHGGRDAWQLPASWHQASERLPMETPLNFVCTADIVGGNSGSPVVNRDLELVGLIFDSNIQSLTSNFFYSDDQARATSVHAGAISVALRDIYDAGFLADELGQ